jgi:hypothetical protein
MASVREHLLEVHKAMAAHHQAQAASHAKLAECYGSMSKTADGDSTHQHIAAEHECMCKSHRDAAAFHAECMEECAKAAEADLNKLQRDGFTSVIPTDVPGFGITAVPRHGAPAKSDLVDKAAVPPQFRHLISSGDE